MGGFVGYIGRFFLILFGLGFLGLGLFMATTGAQQARAEADRVESLRPLTVATLDDGQPGSEALVEGRISAANPPVFREFVAYIREEYRGSDDDNREEWKEDERRTPRLRIEVADGVVSLANDSYGLERSPHHWQESDSLSWNGFTGEGTKRYLGFQAGDTALAVGTLAAGSEGLVFQAERVYGGTRSAYVADRQSTARWLPWLGGIFGVAGVAVLAVGLWLLRR